MSLFVKCSKGRVVGLLLLLAVSLIASSAVAQSDATPKWDLFAGYQWIHPGGNVPQPFSDFNNPGSYSVPDMAKGFGTALTYNFDRHFGLEADLGHNWGNNNYELEASIGPRLMLRTETANYFVHTLISLNRLDISGLNSQNGIGAVLGGGMDLPLKKWAGLPVVRSGLRLGPSQLFRFCVVLLSRSAAGRIGRSSAAYWLCFQLGRGGRVDPDCGLFPLRPRK